MRVTMFPKNPHTYSCNVYLIRGNSNSFSDINTLIDTGTDDFVYRELQEMSTGIGKRRVEQVILTHEHFDHSGGLPLLIKEYNPSVWALSRAITNAREPFDGMIIKAGDCDAMIIHTPGHSSDSLCVYIPSEKILFSGDTPVMIRSAGGTYTSGFLDALQKLVRLDIRTIYSGHDNSVYSGVNDILKNTLDNVLHSTIIPDPK